MAVIRDPMPAFELFQPTSVADAQVVLRSLRSRRVGARRRSRQPRLAERPHQAARGGCRPVRHPGAEGHSAQSGEGLEIGATTTLTEVVRHPVVRERYSILLEAAEAAASPQIRNQGTIGGNVSQDTRCWYYRAGWPCYRAGGNICYADTPECDQPRARHPRRRSLRGRQSVRHRACADCARRTDGDPHGRRRASGSCRLKTTSSAPASTSHA